MMMDAIIKNRSGLRQQSAENRFQSQTRFICCTRLNREKSDDLTNRYFVHSKHSLSGLLHSWSFLHLANALARRFVCLCLYGFTLQRTWHIRTLPLHLFSTILAFSLLFLVASIFFSFHELAVVLWPRPDHEPNSRCIVHPTLFLSIPLSFSFCRFSYFCLFLVHPPLAQPATIRRTPECVGWRLAACLA